MHDKAEMDKPSRPSGQRFTAVYRERPSVTEDSARFRRRLSHKLAELVNWDVILTLRSETGHYISADSTHTWWLKFIAELPRDELLDFITDTVRAFVNNDQRPDATAFLKFTQRAMAEENIAFELDGSGGVHYRVDEAFQLTKTAALQVLEGDNAIAAREAFEEAHQALTGHPSDTLTAVRRAFDAVENLFKIKYGTSRLGATEIKSKMQGAGGESGKRANDAARRINAAFAEWTNGCHQYRHAPGEPDPTPPPRWLAVSLVDGAATYIRYLSALD